MLTNEAPPPAEATAQFARNVFRELQQAIVQHEAGALAGEVEAVHDMRVGIRRLRVALGNFRVCLSKEDRRHLRARLEHLADALGGVRDLDVMIEALKSKLANRSAEQRAAISRFINRLRARRRRRHQRLVGYLQSLEYADFKLEFQTGAAPALNLKEPRNEQAA